MQVAAFPLVGRCLARTLRHAPLSGWVGALHACREHPAVERGKTTFASRDLHVGRTPHRRPASIEPLDALAQLRVPSCGSVSCRRTGTLKCFVGEEGGLTTHSLPKLRQTPGRGGRRQGQQTPGRGGRQTEPSGRDRGRSFVNAVQDDRAHMLSHVDCGSCERRRAVGREARRYVSHDAKRALNLSRQYGHPPLR
jgi:hypothetical protein